MERTRILGMDLSELKTRFMCNEIIYFSVPVTYCIPIKNPMKPLKLNSNQGTVDRSQL